MDIEKFVTENYENMNDPELAKACNLTVLHIRSIRKRLGIKRNKSWTPEEEKRLEKIYPDASWNMLIKEFGCNKQAITTKANSMGVKRSRRQIFKVRSRAGRIGKKCKV